MSEASVVMERTVSRTGSTRRVVFETTSFILLMAVIISVVTVNSFLAMDRESVRGWTIWARRGMNWR